MDRWETDSKKNVPTNTEIAIYRSSSRWKIALFAVGFEDVGNLIAARETTNYSSYAQVILAAWLTDRIEKGPRLSLVIGAAGVASMVVDVISISGYRIRYTRPYPARGITIHFGTMDIVGEWRVTDRRGFCGMPAQNASPSPSLSYLSPAEGYGFRMKIEWRFDLGQRINRPRKVLIFLSNLFSVSRTSPRGELFSKLFPSFIYTSKCTMDYTKYCISRLILKMTLITRYVDIYRCCNIEIIDKYKRNEWK